jgi:DnaD/phage-associated family protein
LDSLEKKRFISIKQRFNDSNEYTLLPYPEYLEEQETQKQIVGSKEQKGIGDVLEAYQNNINPVYGSMERDELIKWYETFENSADILLKAIEIAVYDNVRKIKYINKILIDWHSNGIKTIAQAEVYTKQREENKKNKIEENKAAGAEETPRYEAFKFDD